MIWIIAKRELLSNIITFRFLVSLIICLALITASAFVLVKDYRVRLENYNRDVIEQVRFCWLTTPYPGKGRWEHWL